VADRQGKAQGTGKQQWLDQCGRQQEQDWKEAQHHCCHRAPAASEKDRVKRRKGWAQQQTGLGQVVDAPFGWHLPKAALGLLGGIAASMLSAKVCTKQSERPRDLSCGRFRKLHLPMGWPATERLSYTHDMTRLALGKALTMGWRLARLATQPMIIIIGL
jgi:hypothetical protein